MRGSCLFMLFAMLLTFCLGSFLTGFLFVGLLLMLCSTGVFIVGSIEAKSSGKKEGIHNCMTCRHQWSH
jgi:hypothetical protein